MSRPAAHGSLRRLLPLAITMLFVLQGAAPAVGGEGEGQAVPCSEINYVSIQANSVTASPGQTARVFDIRLTNAVGSGASTVTSLKLEASAANKAEANDVSSVTLTSGTTNVSKSLSGGSKPEVNFDHLTLSIPTIGQGTRDIVVTATLSAGADPGDVLDLQLAVKGLHVQVSGADEECFVTAFNPPSLVNVIATPVPDTTPPVLTLPANIGPLEATGATGRVVTFTATSLDAKDGAITPTCTPSSGSSFALGTTTVQCSATDQAGNKAQGSFTITILDTTKPTLSGVPGNATVEATGAAGAPYAWAAPTATDLVSGSLAVVCSPASGSTFALGATTVSCSATDGAGNKASGAFTVTVQDTTKPILAGMPTDATIEATGPAGAVRSWTLPTATDAVSGSRVVACTPASGSTFALGTTTVSCSATDAAGNVVTGSFKTTVQDTTKPTLSGLPSDMVVEATSSSGAKVSWTSPTAFDAVSGSVPVTCSPVSGSTFALGATTVTCSATDVAGNVVAGSFKVTVQDTTKPVVTDVPNDVTIEATGPAGAAASFSLPKASDVVSGNLPVSCSRLSGSAFSVGATIVTCSSTDDAGNLGTASFKVTVQDTTKPVLAGMPSDVTVDADAASGASYAWTSPTATDLVSGNVAVSCTPSSGSVFPVGYTTVTCTATDGAGNGASGTFKVKVEYEADDDHGHDDHAPACGEINYSAIESGSSSVSAGQAGRVFDIRLTTQAQSSISERTVTSLALEASSSNTASKSDVSLITLTSGSASVSKSLGGADKPEVKFDGLSLSIPKTGTGTLDIIVTATLAAGASPGALLDLQLEAQGLHVQKPGKDEECFPSPFNPPSSVGVATSPPPADTTPPVLTLPANIGPLEATGPSGAPATYVASAIDTKDGFITPACTPPSGSAFPVGVTTVTCTATDQAGNKATGSFTVTVRDTTKPTLSGVPSDATLEATGPAGASYSWASPTATDLVSGSVAVVCSPASGSTFALGTTTITCTATDAAGNAATSSFKVTVQDTTRPVLSGMPSDATVEATGSSGAVSSWTAPIASDLVSGSVAVVCSPASGSTFALGTTTVTCTATDAAGNKASASFKVTVQDTTKPVLAGVPSDVTSEASGPTGAAYSWPAPSATDAVSGTIAVTCTPASGSTFALAATTVTCTATDAAGNKASASFKVTVQDTTKPVLAGVPSDLTVEATGSSGAVSSWTPPTASDLVSGSVAVVCSPASGSTFALGTTTITCTTTDAAGNAATSSFKVKVQDTTKPVLSGMPSDATVEATGSSGAVHSWTAPIASDLVSGTVVVTCNQVSGGTFALGSTTVMCTATDAAGNSAAGSFKVKVQDTTKPTLTLPSALSASATQKGAGKVSFITSATDIVDGTDAVTCIPASGSAFPLGRSTVMCTATDAAGNQASASFNITVAVGTLAAVNVTGPSSMGANTTATFEVVGLDAYGNPVPLDNTSFPYTAPKKAGPATACTTVAGITGCASLAVTPGPITSLRIETENVEVGADSVVPVTFIASAKDAYGNPVTINSTTDVLWTVQPSTGSGFSGNVLKPGRIAGVFIVQAALKSAPEITATAQLRIVPGKAVKLVVTPDRADVQFPGKFAFGGAVIDAYGNLVQSKITWSLDKAALGSIGSSTGIFQAGKTGSGTVTAKDAFSSLFAEAEVKVNEKNKPAIGARITPTDSTVQAGSSVGFVAVAYDEDGVAVSTLVPSYAVENVTVGTVGASSGVFTGYKVGSTTVTASLGGFTVKAQVTVVPGPLAQIRVLPSHATLNAGSSVRFTGLGLDAYSNVIDNTPIVWDNGNPELGSIDQAGFFQAGPTDGVDRLTARSGQITRQFVVTIVGTVAPANEVTYVKSTSSANNFNGLVATAETVGIKSGDVGSKLSIPAPDAAPKSLLDDAKEKPLGQMGAAGVTLGSKTNNLALTIETHPGGYNLTPDEIDVGSLVQTIQKIQTADPGMYLTVHATEDGEPVSSARLNQILDTVDVNFSVPSSYFALQGLDPSKPRIVEYSDGLLVRDDLPATLVSDDGLNHNYNAHFSRFSSFAIVWSAAAIAASSPAPAPAAAPAASPASASPATSDVGGGICCGTGNSAPNHLDPPVAPRGNTPGPVPAPAVPAAPPATGSDGSDGGALLVPASTHNRGVEPIQAMPEWPPGGSIIARGVDRVTARLQTSDGSPIPPGVTATVDGVDVQVVLAGDLLQLPTGVLAEGIHTVQVFGGGQLLSAWSFTVDLTPPVVDALDPTPGGETSRQPLIQARFHDALTGIDPTKTVLRLDGLLVAPQATTNGLRFQPSQPLSPGKHTLELHVSDKAGNTATSYAEFVIADTFPWLLLAGIGLVGSLLLLVAWRRGWFALLVVRRGHDSGIGWIGA